MWGRYNEKKYSQVCNGVDDGSCVCFDDFCKSKGKIWNKEKLQWEEYIWMPKKDEKYYYINTIGEVAHTNNTLSLDQLRIEFGNCFQTIEKAEKVAEKVKELFKSL